MRVRTQIYLDREQHITLVETARKLNVLLAELISQVLDRFIEEQQEVTAREELLSIVGLGSSGSHNVAEKHDQYLC